MRSLRFWLFVALMSLSTMAFAQSDAPKSSAVPTAPDAVAQPDAQKSFDVLKTMAGSWEGELTTFPPEPTANHKLSRLSLRVTSMGNSLVHEIEVDGRPDHPVTMFYVDSDRLLLTHYCDAGNRPRMVGKVSPDGKTVEFTFLDLSGSNQYGHMQHALFTSSDANHHIEEWTYMGPGDKPVRAHFDLHRTSEAGLVSGK